MRKELHSLWGPWSFRWSSSRRSRWWEPWRPRPDRSRWPRPRRDSSSGSSAGTSPTAWSRPGRKACWPSPEWSSRCWRGWLTLLGSLKLFKDWLYRLMTNWTSWKIFVMGFRSWWKLCKKLRMKYDLRTVKNKNPGYLLNYWKGSCFVLIKSFFKLKKKLSKGMRSTRCPLPSSPSVHHLILTGIFWKKNC